MMEWRRVYVNRRLCMWRYLPLAVHRWIAAAGGLPIRRRLTTCPTKAAVHGGELRQRQFFGAQGGFGPGVDE